MDRVDTRPPAIGLKICTEVRGAKKIRFPKFQLSRCYTTLRIAPTSFEILTEIFTLILDLFSLLALEKLAMAQKNIQTHDFHRKFSKESKFFIHFDQEYNGGRNFVFKLNFLRNSWIKLHRTDSSKSWWKGLSNNHII